MYTLNIWPHYHPPHPLWWIVILLQMFLLQAGKWDNRLCNIQDDLNYQVLLFSTPNPHSTTKLHRDPMSVLLPCHLLTAFLSKANPGSWDKILCNFASHLQKHNMTYLVTYLPYHLNCNETTRNKKWIFKAMRMLLTEKLNPESTLCAEWWNNFR